MWQTSSSIEGSGAEGDLKCGELVQDVSTKNISMGPGNNHCDILVKKVVPFCPFLKCLPEGQLKSSGLTAMADYISKWPGIGCVMWL